MTNRILPAAAVLAASLAALALAGCVVGPNYAGPPSVAPSAEAAGAFHRAEDLAATAPAAAWWLGLNDPALNGLESQAIAANPSLEVARARISQSRASLTNARAQRLPTISASAAYLRTHGATSLLAGGSTAAATGAAGGTTVVSSEGAGGDFEFETIGGTATWEPDFFGGKARGVEAARARYQAAEYDLHDAQVSLTAEVASAYVTLRDLQTRLQLQQEDADTEARVLRDTLLRVKGGTVSELDAERLNDQLQTTRAEFAPLQAQVAEQLDRLCALLGKEPGALDAALAAPAALPLPPASVAVGDPASLLRRRPDIRAAERRIQASNAVIGQKTADLFPKVNVFGNLGFGGSDASRLLSGDSFTYAVAPFLQWNVLDFGRVRSTIELAKGQTAEAVADYRRVVLIALQDAETSVSRYARQRDRVQGLMRVQASADKVATMTGLRVKGGTASLIDQLDAERQRVNARQGVAAAQAQLTLDYVALQKSLGLGWAPPGAS